MILPPAPAFSHQPAIIGDIIGQSVGKALEQLGLEQLSLDQLGQDQLSLDQLGLEQRLCARWQGPDRN